MHTRHPLHIMHIRCTSYAHTLLIMCTHATHCRRCLTIQVTSIAGSRHSAIATADGHVWTMGHDDSRGGGGHGSIPMMASGQLGRPGGSAPARVLGELEVRAAVGVGGFGARFRVRSTCFVLWLIQAICQNQIGAGQAAGMQARNATIALASVQVCVSIDVVHA